MAYHYLCPDIRMLVHILESWVLSALALWIVAKIIPGIEVRDFGVAMLATVVIGLVNATIGTVLRILSFPFIFLTLGLFLLVINAALLGLSALFTPGFRVRGFIPALLGSVVLTVLTSILRYIAFR
jgi:putative membrane protein